MKTLATTKMSSKGQVVIPEDIRIKLGLTTGAQFIVLGEDDIVIMKTINSPSMRDFDTLIRKARKNAKLAGLTQSDITRAVNEVRSEK